MSTPPPTNTPNKKTKKPTDINKESHRLKENDQKLVKDKRNITTKNANLPPPPLKPTLRTTNGENGLTRLHAGTSDGVDTSPPVAC